MPGTGKRGTTMLTKDKIRGVIFGAAIGDALGYPVEFRDVRPSHPMVKGLTRRALYSDDTQMMRAVFEGLLRWSGGDVLVRSLQAGNTPADQIGAAAEEVAEEFIAWAKSPDNNRAPGNACMTGCYYLEAGRDWRKCGAPGAGGCGAAMRSQPYGLFLHADPQRAAWWAAEHALMTHGHPMGQASAAAMAAMVALALRPHNQPEVIADVTAMIAEQWDQGTADMLREAAATEDSAEEVLDRWRGWAGHEAVAASLWCFLKHPQSYVKTVLLAVNSPGDSDSLGCMAGALSGAFLGASAIPTEWMEQVEDSQGLEVLTQRVADRLSVEREQ
jgi:ADP-ribosylglycohydrolase